MKRCVFAGTFDPFTIGHDDTVKKCLALFDEVVIAIAENRRKHCMFSLEERLCMVRETYKEEPRVRVLAWDGVIVDLLKRKTPAFMCAGSAIRWISSTRTPTSMRAAISTRR